MKIAKPRAESDKDLVALDCTAFRQSLTKRGVVGEYRRSPS